jgi:hypothetical protein
MATRRISILDSMPHGPARKAAGSLRLAPTMKNDVFLLCSRCLQNKRAGAL